MYTSMARELLFVGAALLAASNTLSAQRLLSTDERPVTGLVNSSDGVRRGTITGPFTTPFSTYRPMSIPAYRARVGADEPLPLADFSNVATAAGLDYLSYFSAAERSRLVRDGIVARPEMIGNFGAAYAHETSSRSLGSFVTVDAVAHGLRVAIDESVRDFARGYARDVIVRQYAMLSSAIQRQLDATSSHVVRRSLIQLLAYAQTGQRLLDSTLSIDNRVVPQVEQEISKIMVGRDLRESSVFAGRQIDYGLFRPDELHAGDPALHAFFAARQWSARVAFVVRGADGKLSAEDARMAFLLARIVSSLSHETDFDREHSLVQEPIALLSGGADDGLSWETIASSIRRYYGDLAPSDAEFVANDQEVVAVARFLSRGVQRGDDVVFRLYNWADARGSDTLNTVMSVPRGNPLTYRQLFGLAPGETTGAWFSSINRAFQYMMQPLALDVHRDDGLPRFVRSDAWRDRGLSSALGGLNDIARPVSTMTMKVVPKADRYASSVEITTDGYIEPAPAAWARIASLAGFLRTGLSKDAGMVSPLIVAKLADIERTSVRLMEIAVKQLEGAELAPEDRKVIASMRTRIVAYETVTESTGGRRSVTTPRDSRYRDGNGFPMAIYVVVPRNDGTPGLMLTRGAVYACVGGVDPQGHMRRDGRPDAWTETFVSTDRSFDLDPTKLVALVADLPADELSRRPTLRESSERVHSVELGLDHRNVSRTNGELWFNVTVPKHDRRELYVTMVDASGRVVRRMDVGRVPETGHVDLFAIDDLPAGRYQIQVEDALGQMLASGTVRVAD